MKGKKNLILLIALIVLAGIILIVERPFKNKTRQKKAEAPLFFPDLDPSAVKQIKISKPDGATVVITGSGNNWTVIYDAEPYPADREMIAEAIEIFLTLRETDLASRNKDKHDLFEVADHNAMTVTLFADSEEPLAALYIGKSGPDFFSTYIRKADTDEVYLSDTPVKSLYDRPAAAWRDRSLFSFNPDEVTELVLAKEDEQIVLGKDTQGNWHLQEPVSGLADTDTVKTLLTGLSTLSASDYADGITLEESEVQKPIIRVTVTLKDTTVRELLIGVRQEEGPYYYVTTGDKKYLYTLHQSIVERLTPSVKELEKVNVEEAVSGEQ